QHVVLRGSNSGWLSDRRLCRPRSAARQSFRPLSAMAWGARVIVARAQSLQPGSHNRDSAGILRAAPRSLSPLRSQGPAGLRLSRLRGPPARPADRIAVPHGADFLLLVLDWLDCAQRAIV